MPPVKHSFFSASSAYRWIACPASVALCAKAPKPKSSSFANEGTAAHELAEKSLITRRMPKDFYGDVIHVGDSSYNVDAEMVESVTLYVREILKEMTKIPRSSVQSGYHVETKFNLRWISGRDDMFGTCDACIPDTFNRTIHVFDLKYGSGNPVYAENNSQLMYYALGILGKFGEFEGKRCLNFDRASLHIVQPRCDESGVSKWELSIQDLMSWGTDTLLPAVDKALSSDPPFNPSLKTCRWCPGKPLCKAYADELSNSSEVSLYKAQEPLLPPVESLSDAQIARILEILPAIKSYMTSVGEYALSRALNGNILPGFKLVRGRKGNRKWKDTMAIEEAFSGILGEDLYDTNLKSPAQVEKLLKERLGRSFSEISLEDFVTREEGSLILVPESDKREEVFTRNALDNFFGEEIK